MQWINVAGEFPGNNRLSGRVQKLPYPLLRSQNQATFAESTLMWGQQKIGIEIIILSIFYIVYSLPEIQRDKSFLN